MTCLPQATEGVKPKVPLRSLPGPAIAIDELRDSM